MEQPSLFDTLLNWLPAILIFLVYLLILTRSVSNGGRVVKLQTEMLEQQRNQNQTLERIAAALEQRVS